MSAHRSKGSSRRASRVRDWLLYIAISLLLIAAIGAFAVYQARTGGSPELPWKWIGFVGMTAFLFGYPIAGRRRSWRSRKFWLAVAILFVVHAAVGLFVLRRVEIVPLTLYSLIFCAEYPVLTAYLEFFCGAQ